MKNSIKLFLPHCRQLNFEYSTNVVNLSYLHQNWFNNFRTMDQFELFYIKQVCFTIKLSQFPYSWRDSCVYPWLTWHRAPPHLTWLVVEWGKVEQHLMWPKTLRADISKWPQCSCHSLACDYWFVNASPLLLNLLFLIREVQFTALINGKTIVLSCTW